MHFVQIFDGNDSVQELGTKWKAFDVDNTREPDDFIYLHFDGNEMDDGANVEQEPLKILITEQNKNKSVRELVKEATGEDITEFSLLLPTPENEEERENQFNEIKMISKKSSSVKFQALEYNSENDEVNCYNIVYKGKARKGIGKKAKHKHKSSSSSKRVVRKFQ